MKKILNSFSYIFHPLFISVYAVLLYFFFGNHYFAYSEIYFVLIQIVIITIFIPITFYYLLLSMGKVDSIMMANKKQRIIPLLIHCCLLFAIIKKSIPPDVFYELHFFFVASLISTLFSLIAIFLGFKASLHMVGISALTLFVMGMSIHFQSDTVFTIAFLVICNGIVATSRLDMKAHTYEELGLGFFIGAIPQIGMMYVWL